MHTAVFLDKDGTLIPDIPYNVAPDRISLYPGVGAGLRQLHQAGYLLIVVSNQSGVARGYFPETALEGVEQRLRSLLEQEGVPLAGFYYCPHHPEGKNAEYAIACTCRKPQPGLLHQAVRDHAIDLSQSWLIGDILNDIEAGRAAGCRTILIDNGNETEWQLDRQRLPHHLAVNFWEATQIIQAVEPHRLNLPNHVLQLLT
jgi:D,D-heptose 1,7-bisphosphate phosphatase